MLNDGNQNLIAVKMNQGKDHHQNVPKRLTNWTMNHKRKMEIVKIKNVETETGKKKNGNVMNTQSKY
jgi:hypothetical protein